MVESLHPGGQGGEGGNPALNGADMSSRNENGFLASCNWFYFIR
jgi:hypothetical protein